MFSDIFIEIVGRVRRLGQLGDALNCSGLVLAPSNEHRAKTCHTRTTVDSTTSRRARAANDRCHRLDLVALTQHSRL
jgi:hypothetical protein